MRCSSKRLSAYTDGALSGDVRRDMERHLLRCQSCRTELAHLRMMKSLLQAVPPPDPPERLVSEITGRVRFREAQRQRRRRRVRFWQGALVGVTAALLVVGVWLFGAGAPGHRGHALASTVDAVVSEHSRHALLLEIGADDWAEWRLTWERR